MEYMNRNEVSEEQKVELKRITDYIRHPDKIVIALGSRGMLPFLTDETYLKIFFKSRLGYELNLKEPETFNEKLQWLKLHDKNPEYIRLVDKAEVKQIVADRIGAEYVIPTYGVWDKFEDIDFSALPDKFVLKCTHDSGSVVIVSDKKKFDRLAAKRKISARLRKNYFYLGREWPYKHIRPRIIAEKYLEVSSGKSAFEKDSLTDYKIMCFNGKARITLACTERFCSENLKVTFFDREWKEMPFEEIHFKKSFYSLPKPESYEQMLMLAEKLSFGIPFARVDFYEAAGNPYFGEITLYPCTGMEGFTPHKWDRQLGDWIDLHAKSFKMRENS